MYYDPEGHKKYQQMMAHLAYEGWEPSFTHDSGRVEKMQRAIRESTIQMTTGPADLLRQLSNLRDEGILTEEEFQAKKAEILKRM